MVKNLQVISDYESIKKNAVHKLVGELRKHFDFEISSLGISFISSKQIHQVNKKFLEHDFSTDVLTFDYSSTEKNLDAEILISIDDALQNAKKYNIKPEVEFARLVIHGILHLVGYDDSNKDEKKMMTEMENQLLKKYNFALL